MGGGLTHSTCERNVASSSKDATTKLRATVYRVEIYLDKLTRSLIEPEAGSAAKAEGCCGRRQFDGAKFGSGKLVEMEVSTECCDARKRGGRAGFCCEGSDSRYVSYSSMVCK